MKISSCWPAMLLLCAAACGDNTSSPQGADDAGNSDAGTSDAGTSDAGTSDGGTVARAVDANTQTATTVTSGGESCAQLTRDTSSCQAARTALGFSGNWLSFSCNVVLGLQTSAGAATTSMASATSATLTFADLPDYKSNYYPTTGSYNFTANGDTVSGTYDSMYTAYTTAFPDPSSIKQQAFTMAVPLSPSHNQTSTSGKGTVGLSLNGVSILDSSAGGTDSIFAESGSFDQCQGHPNNQSGGTYHYHGEPWSISYDDNKLIGIMLDGYWVYGRKDHDGSDQSANWSSTSDDLYVYGGHVGPSPLDGSGSEFHYHVTAWTACYDETLANGGATHATDDGSPSCTLSSGKSVTDYFLTGHGNGGVFKQVPAGVTADTPAIRYLYGAAGTCSGC